MKKLLLITSFILLSCSRDSEPLCQQTWNVTEWEKDPCTSYTSSTFNIDRTFKCDEIKDIKEGQDVIYMTNGCKKFYRRYNKRVN